MAVGAIRWQRAVAPAALVGLWLGAFLVGCGGQTPAPDKPERGKNPPVSAIASPKAAAAQPSAAPAGPARSTFNDAIVEEPPEDQFPPPPETKTHKSVGKLYERIAAPGGLWDQVVFTTPDGKKLKYTATITTDLGSIKLELWPDVAPNHVRNFVALARAGYYDGLEFDRTVREEMADEPGKFFECLEAGCPLGTGDSHYGSIGYWLKPEFNAELQHEEGCVGACRGEEADTAATRFYITLGKAPFLNGNYTLFGKVTQGLDVARKIFQQPLREDEQDTDGDHRPLNPVVIRKVTVRTKEVDKSGPGGEN
jgi:peptidyl-prolyl cis-trans isomerase B (cyclophilin B)